MKALLEEDVKSIVFNRPSARNQPERLCSSNICAVAINRFTIRLDNRWVKTCMGFNCGKKKETEKLIDIVGKVIINSVKTDREITNINNKTFLEVIEAPFAVGLALHVHKLARSKELINMLSNTHLSISYDQLLKIEALLNNAVFKKLESCNGVYVPSGIQHK